MTTTAKKYIFITFIEGVEARNLLRTDVVKKLLENKDIVVVGLVRSIKRAEYYKTQFAHERLIFEVITEEKAKFIDSIFIKLKTVLLKTPTTDLKRKLLYLEKKNYFYYHIGNFVRATLSHSFIRRAVRWLDYKLVYTSIYTVILDKYSPKVVVMAHIFSEPELHLLRESKRRGITTIGFINTWDKVTSRWMLRLLPDEIIVYNNIVANEVAKYNEFPLYKIYIAGLPQYDRYFKYHEQNKQNPTLKKERFFKALECTHDTKVILYAPMGVAFSDIDWATIDFLRDMQKKGTFGDNTELLVRFQPNDFFDEQKIKDRPGLKYDYPGIRFSAERGVDWDMDEGQLNHLADTLNNVSLLLCHATSLSIDAVIFDVPVINIGYDIVPARVPRYSPQQYFKTEHYKKALATGGIKLVRSRYELIECANNYLRDRTLDSAGRKRLIQEQVKFTDGEAGNRIARFILFKTV